MSSLRSGGGSVGSVDVVVREGAHVVEMQRRRLLGALVDLVFERGARALTVAMICERAGLSRRTFYELFEDREACLLVAFEDQVEHATRIVEQAVGDESRWRERVRTGLAALLSFLEDDPGAARLLVVDALTCGEQTLNARRRVLAHLVVIVDEGRGEAKQGYEPPPLTAEGIVGAVSSVIHARILDRDEGSLTEARGSVDGDDSPTISRARRSATRTGQTSHDQTPSSLPEIPLGPLQWHPAAVDLQDCPRALLHRRHPRRIQQTSRPRRRDRRRRTNIEAAHATAQVRADRRHRDRTGQGHATSMVAHPTRRRSTTRSRPRLTTPKAFCE